MILEATTTAGSSSNLLAAHLWHILEAAAFLVMSLGGIAVAEFIQSRNRSNVAQFGAGALHRNRSESWGTDSFRNARLSPAEGHLKRRVTLLPLVALAGVGAAGVHVVVMPTHFGESWMYGTFFLVAAISQLSYSAWLLTRPSRALVIAGVMGNLSIVVLWLVTRTIGIPLGPAAGAVEKVGALDLLAGVFELTAVIGGVLLLRRPAGTARLSPAVRPQTWTPIGWLLGAAMVIAIAVTALVAPPS